MVERNLRTNEVCGERESDDLRALHPSWHHGEARARVGVPTEFTGLTTLPPRHSERALWINRVIVHACSCAVARFGDAHRSVRVRPRSRSASARAAAAHRASARPSAASYYDGRASGDRQEQTMGPGHRGWRSSFGSGGRPEE